MKYALIGMGKSGDAARAFLKARGVLDSDLVSFDDKPGKADTSDPRRILDLAAPGTLVVSPGYPLSTPWIREALKQGFKLTGEIGLACEILQSEKIIGVTGSVGKSTTVALLREGLASFSKTAFVGGNFGIPFCEYATTIARGGPRADWIVLELSSFQLENADPLKLDFSAITSYVSNHLERYRDRDEYFAVKWSILARTKGVCLLNSASDELAGWARTHPGNWRAVSKDDPALAQFGLSKSLLLGSHNQDNLALAASLAMEAGWPPASIEAMKKYAGLAHRLENAGTHHGVSFVNDSKATTIDSVITAVRGLPAPAQTLWILVGGRDKKLPWKDLAVLADPRRKFVFFGECRDVAMRDSGLRGPSFAKLGEAIDHAIGASQNGDTVLLSPGGSSLDEFANFEERGEFFKQRIRSRPSLRPS